MTLVTIGFHTERPAFSIYGKVFFCRTIVVTETLREIPVFGFFL
jgi:hypothetical protein